MGSEIFSRHEDLPQSILTSQQFSRIIQIIDWVIAQVPDSMKSRWELREYKSQGLEHLLITKDEWEDQMYCWDNSTFILVIGHVSERWISLFRLFIFVC